MRSDFLVTTVWVMTVIAGSYNLVTTVVRVAKVARVEKGDIMAVVVVLFSATKSVKPSVNRPVIITGRDSSDMISIVVPTTITMTTMTTMLNDE
mmetsp:Transcript_14666/g.16684  ORF Transcript_14666/g.16684 Transcript_14666/m.16684 type:complete len:94 (-) Transcript_14666:4-285(-)